MVFSLANASYFATYGGLLFPSAFGVIGWLVVLHRLELFHG